MEEKMITIPVKEYKKLLEGNIRIKIFVDYAKNASYSILKEECEKIFGFNINDKED